MVFFVIRIYITQDCTATAKHGVKRKRKLTENKRKQVTFCPSLQCLPVQIPVQKPILVIINQMSDLDAGFSI